MYKGDTRGVLWLALSAAGTKPAGTRMVARFSAFSAIVTPCPSPLSHVSRGVLVMASTRTRGDVELGVKCRVLGFSISRGLALMADSAAAIRSLPCCALVTRFHSFVSLMASDALLGWRRHSPRSVRRYRFGSRCPPLVQPPLRVTAINPTAHKARRLRARVRWCPMPHFLARVRGKDRSPLL